MQSQKFPEVILQNLEKKEKFFEKLNIIVKQSNKIAPMGEARKKRRGFFHQLWTLTKKNFLGWVRNY